MTIQQAEAFGADWAEREWDALVEPDCCAQSREATWHDPLVDRAWLTEADETSCDISDDVVRAVTRGARARWRTLCAAHTHDD